MGEVYTEHGARVTPMKPIVCEKLTLGFLTEMIRLDSDDNFYSLHQNNSNTNTRFDKILLRRLYRSKAEQQLFVLANKMR